MTIAIVLVLAPQGGYCTFAYSNDRIPNRSARGLLDDHSRKPAIGDRILVFLKSFGIQPT
jgi:hypothetical protein